jgi:hypothetical protein
MVSFELEGEEMILNEALKLSKRIKRDACDWELDLTDKHLIAETIAVCHAIANDWEPIIEKKKKTVVMYQALFVDTNNRHYIRDYLYKDESHAIKHSGDAKEFIKLLTDRPIEVEVEECEGGR